MRPHRVLISRRLPAGRFLDEQASGQRAHAQAARRRGAADPFLRLPRRAPEFDLEKIIEDLSEGLGSWTYVLVAILAFLETGAFVGLVAPGEFTVLLGGAVAGQGDISLPLILAITWLSAFLGDTVSFLLGARLGREFLIRHGERVRITRRAPEAGRGLLRQARRQDDHHRPLHRAGAGAGAVHRRHQQDAVQQLRAVQHHRHRALGHHLHPDRLLRLAEPRHGREHRRARG